MAQDLPLASITNDPETGQISSPWRSALSSYFNVLGGTSGQLFFTDNNLNTQSGSISIGDAESTIFINGYKWKIDLLPNKLLAINTDKEFELVTPSDVLEVFQTGAIQPIYGTVAKTGWIIMDDGTIGNAASGATTYAADDAEDLFTLIWDNIADTYCPVSSGRGASAAADFAANKTIALPRTSGRAIGAAGAGSGLTSRAVGEYLGEEEHSLVAGEIPDHLHNSTMQYYDTASSGPQQYFQRFSNGNSMGEYATNINGQGFPHENMQEFRVVNFQIKL